MAAELFETLRTYDGAPALLDAHLARMGAADPDALKRRVDAALAHEFDDVVIRIVGQQIELRPLPAETLDAVDVGLSTVSGYSYPQKSTDRSLHERLLAEAHPDAFDVLIVDDGLVIEGTIANVFTLRDDTLFTPPLGRCLPGITRAAIFSVAPSLGLRVEEAPLTMDSLSDADEVLLTNSLRGVKRVASITGLPVGDRAPGVQRELQAALLEHYRKHA